MVFLANSVRCSKSALQWGMMRYIFDRFDNVVNIIISTTISRQAKSALPWQAFAAQKASRPCVVSRWKVSFGGPGELRVVLPQCIKRRADGERNISLCNEVGQMVSAPKTWVALLFRPA